MSSWNPLQYNRFADEREQPFWDLRSLLEPVESATVVDLGCGDGRLTALLHAGLQTAKTVGIDSSPTMLAAARQHLSDAVSFVEGDIATWRGSNVDIAFSNAALQWVEDHPTVIRRWREALAPHGQLAIQMPTNADHLSHRVSVALAKDWLGESAPGDPVAKNVLRPEQYAELLHALGFSRQHVRLQVYGHVLASSSDVVEWVKGTSLTRFKSVLTDEEFERFVDAYRRRLLAEIGDRRPYFYTFKRLLLWGRLD